MGFDIGKLRLGEQIAGVSAILLLIDTFLSWFSVNVPDVVAQAAAAQGLDTSVNAWDAYSWVSLLMLLTVVVVLAWIVITATGTKVALPVAASVIATGLSVFTLLVVIYRTVINQPGPNSLVNNEIGAYLGIALLAALSYGCYVAMKTE